MTSKPRLRSDPVGATSAADPDRLPLSGDPRAEQKMVEGCVAGEEKAWEELFLRYRESLYLRIRAILGPRARDANLVDEIGAEVWSTLCRKNGSLLARFQAESGHPLCTFMAAIARIEVLRFRRAEHQRRCHEMSPEIIQLTAESTDDDGYRLVTMGLEEFAGVLTPCQRQFLQEHLLNGVHPISQAKLSASNGWQMRHRIRRKLLEYLDVHPNDE